MPGGVKAKASEAYPAYLLEVSGVPLNDRQAAIIERVKAVPTLGNMKLLNLSVNREAQHKDFQVKKQLLIANTNLSLNVKLIGQDSWDEDAIAERGKLLAAAALKIYPR